jgi:hypothetical protein
MLIVASAILLVLGILAYRKALAARLRSGSDRGPGAEGVGLLALRILVLVLFGAILVAAVLSKVWVVRPRTVAVLLDVSQSMAAVKADSAAAAMASSLVPPEGAKAVNWEFAESARVEVRVQESKVRSQEAGRTRIGVALSVAAKARPGAVVLLSDGQDNGTEDPLAAARELGVPVYAVGFGGAAKRNLAISDVSLPAVVYAGETTEVLVRVSSVGFGTNATRAGVALRGQGLTAALGTEAAEQDLAFKTVFEKPGRQVFAARAESLPGEDNYADNVKSVAADVKPGKVRVVYLTNRPGTGTRLVPTALKAQKRIDLRPVVAVTGGFPVEEAASADVFVLDNVAETGSPEFWRGLSARVLAGAGVLVLAGPGFLPGPVMDSMLGSGTSRSGEGKWTPELTSAGRMLPWFADFGRVPPFAGARTPDRAGGASVWVRAREDGSPLILAGKNGKGRFVLVAGYPIWRWGFGPDLNPYEETPLSLFLGGVVRYLAERDTSPFMLEPARPGFLAGEPVRLQLRAMSADGQPWQGLGVVVGARARRQTGETLSEEQKAEPEPQAVMTEAAPGVYQAQLDALAPGEYHALARVTMDDSILGRAGAEFAVAAQSIELARTGLNQALLSQLASSTGGRFVRAESLGSAGLGITLGSYQRRFVFDARRAVWAYVLVALLAGAEWLLRRKRGLL